MSNKIPRFVKLENHDSYIYSKLPLTHYDKPTNTAHYIGGLKVNKEGLRLFNLESQLIGTCHLVVEFDDKPSIGRPKKIERDMAIRLYFEYLTQIENKTKTQADIDLSKIFGVSGIIKIRNNKLIGKQYLLFYGDIILLLGNVYTAFLI